MMNVRSAEQLLMRQLQIDAAPAGGPSDQAGKTAGAEEAAEEEEEGEEVDEEDEEEEEEKEEEQEEGDDDEEEDEDVEEDLFGQITTSNPELLLPATPQPGKGFGTRDDWGDSATLALLQAWGDKCTQLNKWHLRRQHWEELAAVVTSRSSSVKTDVQCKNRVDTLKKKFKQEKEKQASQGTQSKWPFYQLLDRLLSMASHAKNNVTTVCNVNQLTGNNVNHGINHGGGVARPVLPCSADAGVIMRNCVGKNCLSSSSSEEAEEEHEKLRKRRRRRSSSSSLTGAIGRLGEVFERMEECKRRRMVDLEKLRMQLTRDLELHRMQLLLQTQMELAKIKQSMNNLDM